MRPLHSGITKLHQRLTGWRGAMRRAAPSARAPSLRWLYLVALMPTLTDFVERSALPDSLSEWLTEIVGGAIVVALVHRVLAQYRNVLALARCDALTGLLNRRVFDEVLQDECARARRFGQALSLVYIDVDDFKHINDRLGHEEGDRVLQQLGTVIQCTIRARIDRGFRLGGDEFALLLPGSDARQARAAVARIRTAFERSSAQMAAGQQQISAGVVQLQPKETAADLVQRADLEMYRHKRSRPSLAAGGLGPQDGPASRAPVPPIDASSSKAEAGACAIRGADRTLRAELA